MARCRFCGRIFAVDELGAHLLSVHAVSPPTRLHLASVEVAGVVKVLDKLRRSSTSFADVADALGLVAGNLKVALEELERLVAEVTGINETLGEHLGEDET